jgi:hypothetical protein
MTTNTAITDETETYEEMEDRLALEAEYAAEELAEDVRRGRASFEF